MSQYHRLLAAAWPRLRLPLRPPSRGHFSVAAVQLIIPFAAGGPTDIVGRIMAAKMGKFSGRPFVVEDKSGAGGNIGAETSPSQLPTATRYCSRQCPPTPSIRACTSTCPMTRSRISRRSARVGVTPTLLLVNPSLPATDVKSLIALIKANPGKYNYGSSGLGSILHLCGEEFKADGGRARNHPRAL